MKHRLYRSRIEHSICMLLIVSLLTLEASTHAFAENQGSITVYVFNQKGDPINRLVNITIISDKKEVTTAQLQPLQNHIKIDNISHTGTYTVWAYAIEDFLRDRFDCAAQGWDEKEVRDNMRDLDTPKPGPEALASTSVTLVSFPVKLMKSHEGVKGAAS